MTQEERLVVSGYTGELMVSPQELLKFAEEVLGRPVASVEYGDKAFWETLRDKLKPRFRELCALISE